MEQKPNDGSANSEFTFDPTNKVIGIIDDPGEVKAALRDLRAAGFTAGEIEVVMGEEGAQPIDVTGGEHGVSVHVVRSTQRLPVYYDVPALVGQIKEMLLAGQYVIGVAAEAPEARDRAHGILKSHGGHFIHFSGRWAAEALEP
jgi:hypothetical protein